MHPSELSYPCYLSILGDLAKVTPHEESFLILNPETANFQTTINAARIGVLENSPSGLWRTLGKRVGCKPSGVRIPYSPPVQAPSIQGFGGFFCCRVHLRVHNYIRTIFPVGGNPPILQRLRDPSGTSGSLAPEMPASFKSLEVAQAGFTS